MDEHSLDKLSRPELVALVIQLPQEVAELRARLDEQDRGSKRQAAPFSKGKRKADPKRPGRKPRQGTFRRREAPSEEEIDRRIDVPLDEEDKWDTHLLPPTFFPYKAVYLQDGCRMR